MNINLNHQNCLFPSITICGGMFVRIIYVTGVWDTKQNHKVNSYKLTSSQKSHHLTYITPTAPVVSTLLPPPSLQVSL